MTKETLGRGYNRALSKLYPLRVGCSACHELQVRGRNSKFLGFALLDRKNSETVWKRLENAQNALEKVQNAQERSGKGSKHSIKNAQKRSGTDSETFKYSLAKDNQILSMGPPQVQSLEKVARPSTAFA